MKSSRFNVEIPINHPVASGRATGAETNLVKATRQAAGKISLLGLEQKKEEFLIFNTFSDSRVVINKELKTAMQKADKKLPLTEEETGYLTQLKELGIMVNDRADEDKELEYWFQKFKFDTSILSITLLTTYDCNMKCTYCFEEGVIKKEKMSRETSQLVIQWLAQKLKSVRPATLRLEFFGGEPMMDPEGMLFIAKNLHQMTSQKDIELDLRMITNGVILPEKHIKEMVQYGLKGIKVTLDGDETAHNQTRIFKNGKGSFKTIIENLGKIKGLVPVSIGCNFDEKNKKSIPALLNRLKAEGLEESVESVDFKPIFQNMENAGKTGKGQFDVCTYSDIEVSDILQFKKETEKKGFSTREGISIGPCEAARENSYTIDPGGKIYKCGGFVGREQFKIGDLHEGLNEENTRFMTTDLWRSNDCEGCKYLPLCGGGCRSSAYVKHEDFNRFACEMKYFNTVLPELLKEELAQ